MSIVIVSNERVKSNKIFNRRNETFTIKTCTNYARSNYFKDLFRLSKENDISYDIRDFILLNVGQMLINIYLTSYLCNIIESFFSFTYISYTNVTKHNCSCDVVHR